MTNRTALILGGRRYAVCYAAFAVYAGGVALFSGGLEHWWGTWAVGGYALAAGCAAAAPGRRLGGGLAVAVSCAGALAAPALWLLTREPTPPDVAVVARSGMLLLHHGTPYLPSGALAGCGWLAYTPYLPVMALFGLPGAAGLPGQTWPWLIAVTFLLLYAACRVTLAPRASRWRNGGQRSGGWRAGGGQRAGGWRSGRQPDGGQPDRGQRAALGTAAFWLACPVMAFPLTMGITDPPVIALTCLALALLARGGRTAGTAARDGRGAQDGRGARGGRRLGRDALLAAVVLGVACAMKYTAWPSLAIVAVMVAVRDGARPAVRFTVVTLAAAAGLVAALAPAGLRHPAAIAANTVAYPLGLTAAKSPAQSPLPGHLLATLGPGGHLAALVLLAAAGLAVAASLVIAPPATPAAAARRIAAGLTALFLLSPATRFGYLIYPVSLYAWSVLASRAEARTERRQAPRAPALAAAGAAGRPGLAGTDVASEERAVELI